MEQQAEVAQPQALPADIEAILQPISADHHPQAEPAAEPVAQPVVAQPVAPVTPAEPTVPLHVLIEERKERQAAQAEQRAIQAQFRQLIEAQQRASQPQPQPIDPVAEPERAFAALANEITKRDRAMQEMAVHQRANTSEMLARGKYGDAKVDEAVQSAIQAGVNQQFMAQPDPYRALIDWQNSQSVAREVGGDLNAFKAKVREEYLAELRAGVRPAAATAAPQVLPPSLSSATRASTTAPVIQDASDFFKNQLFAKPQRT